MSHADVAFASAVDMPARRFYRERDPAIDRRSGLIDMPFRHASRRLHLPASICYVNDRDSRRISLIAIVAVTAMLHSRVSAYASSFLYATKRYRGGRHPFRLPGQSGARSMNSQLYLCRRCFHAGDLHLASFNFGFRRFSSVFAIDALLFARAPIFLIYFLLTMMRLPGLISRLVVYFIAWCRVYRWRFFWRINAFDAILLNSFSSPAAAGDVRCFALRHALSTRKPFLDDISRFQEVADYAD